MDILRIIQKGPLTNINAFSESTSFRNTVTNFFVHLALKDLLNTSELFIDKNKLESLKKILFIT